MVLNKFYTEKEMKVKNLKKGQRVWECFSGKNFEYYVLEDARIHLNGHACKVISRNLVEMDLFQHKDEGLHHYGPRLYSEPQYVRVVDGKTVYEGERK
jgi:hypothetical protein